MVKEDFQAERISSRNLYLYKGINNIQNSQYVGKHKSLFFLVLNFSKTVKILIRSVVNSIMPMLSS